ncbi:MAG: hypothetical protein IKL14_02265 [Alphaproteobacteria bacterium]|nr:hypothetical protein [Alphaproteobacteria bacterium]
MNIFIMILIALFMAGYYMLDSPSQNVANQTTDYAITKSDLRSVAQCMTAAHNAQINGMQFDDICTQQNQIVSAFICLDERLKKTNCEIVRNKKPAFSYLISASAPIIPDNYNGMMEILEKHYPDAGTFGIFFENMIMAGGTATKRIVPKEIISEMNLQDGQLVYLTQYEMPEVATQFASPMVFDVECPVGTTKIYRFGRWQCISYNTKTDCGGDMIWDSEQFQCVPDESRKPLCADSQTAVMVENVWECIDPFPEKQCPDKMIARLNYNTLEWECVTNPEDIKESTKCDNFFGATTSGALGTTLRIPQTSCTDCEKLITNLETCEATCVPDPEKLNNSSCYPGNPTECTGSTRAFYFGFPNRTYINKVQKIIDIPVLLDNNHSQNRKFNCMDCGGRGINQEKSRPPYVVVCN